MDAKILNLYFFYLYSKDGFIWFRFFGGYGLKIKDTTRHPLLFSERLGINDPLRIGKWAIGILNPDRNEK